MVLRKSVACLLLIASGLIISCGIIWQRVSDLSLNAVYSAARDANQGELEFDRTSVDLGVLSPSERRTIRMSMSNVGVRKIEGLRLVADCGCIAGDLTESTIEPGQMISFNVSILAPSSPQEMLKTVSVRSTGMPDKKWSFHLNGSVQASIWATPAVVSLELDRNGRAEAVIAIDFASDFQPDEIACLAGRVNLEKFPPVDKRQLVRVQIDDVLEGSDTLEVYRREAGAGDRLRILQIPVSWRPRPAIVLRPETILLTSGASGAPVDRTIICHFDRDIQSAELIADPLVPWVSVLDARSLGRRVASVRLQLKAELAGRLTDETVGVLQIGIEGDDSFRAVAYVKGPVAHSK